VRIRWFVLVCLLVSATLVTSLESPATARSGSMAYPVGDAPASVDITRLSVVNGVDRFSMRVEVRDLGERGYVDFHYWRGRRSTPPPRSLIVEVRYVDGQARARFLSCGREDCVRARCEGLSATWRPQADVVAISAPQSCYPRGPQDAGPVTVGRFFAGAGVGGDDDDGSSEPLLLTRG